MSMLLENLSILNPLTVAAATVAIVFTGLLWYSQPLFGRAFIRLSGIRPGDIRAEDKRRTGIVSILTAILFAALVGIIHHHVDKSANILLHSVVFIWLFIMLSQLNGFMFRREPFALFLLTTLRSLLTLLAAAAVFIFWQ